MARDYSYFRTLGQIQANPMRADAAVAVVFAILIALCAAFSIHRQNPPEVAPSGVSPEAFSASRAMNHLAAIAEQPHPMGSSAHAAVRDYIMKELSSAGLKPELQQTIGVNHTGRPLRVGAVENIIARLKGTGGEKSVLLVSHYDSMPNSMGASDDGSAVVTLLETIRALKAGAALKNDVVFLFSDGEENGQLGANAFADEHAGAKKVGVVLNFEARGNKGPVIMFETSDENGWLIGEFAHAAPFPIATSLSYEIYKLLPNDTDLTVFKKANMSGLNFAYIEGLSHYHTLLDNLGEIDARSLQHQGSYALTLTRHFGNLDLRQTKERNAVYFDVLGKTLVRYSTLWVIPCSLLVCALFVVLTLVGLRRGRLTLGGIALGFLALLSSVVVSSLITTLLWKALWLLRGGAGPTPDAAQSGLYLLSFVALAVAVTAAIYLLIGKRASVESLALGSMLWWLILMLLTSLNLPGGSFLFTWPLFFSLLGVGALILAKKREKRTGMFNLLLPSSICAVPAIILLVPAIHQIFVGLTLNWTTHITAMIALLLGLLVPPLQFINVPLKGWLAGVFALGGLVLFGAVSLTQADGARHPRTDTILYGLNADTGKAVWASDDERADEWTGQFLSTGTERGTLPDLAYANSSKLYLKSPAPAASLPAPQVELLDDHTTDGTKIMRMRLSSPRQAAVMSVYVDSKAEVVKASVNDKQIEDERDRTPAATERKNQWGVRIFGFPRQGVELQWEVRASEPLKIRLVDQSYGLPQLSGAAFKPRPQSLIPSVAPYTDSTFISKSYVF